MKKDFCPGKAPDVDEMLKALDIVGFSWLTPPCNIEEA